MRVFFQGSRITSSGYEDSFLIQDYLERLDPGYKVFLDPLSKSHELVWIGLSEEKRKWRGKKDAIIRLIDKSINLLSSPVFVFDGLTCPAFKSVGEFKLSSCVRELTLLGEILREVGNIPYIDLIGEKSDKKIITSQYVDFYFSSALTDSMWPAHFGNSKGIAYSSTIAKLSVHRHPLTYKIPSNFISDADDGISNWSQKGFEVDPFALDSIMEDGIKFTSELISEANKFGVFEDAGQQRGVAIKTKQGTDKAVLLVNTESPVTISPYGSDRQEGVITPFLIAVGSRII